MKMSEDDKATISGLIGLVVLLVFFGYMIVYKPCHGECFKTYAHPELQCPSVDDYLQCSRLKGHKGNHMHCTLDYRHDRFYHDSSEWNDHP